MSRFDFSTILIVANSGRMLAQLAKNAGLTPVVIDCFCDSDTLLLATDAIKVDSLAVEHLMLALLALNKVQNIKYAIYGSGFESHNKSLQYLYQHYTVLGNAYAVFTVIQNKINFFSKLKVLQIPYPPVSFTVPKTSEGWLLKPMQGEGGAGIRKYKQQYIPSTPCYWQRQIEGAAMSVIFVTDGKQVIIYGFHKQQIISLNEDEFVFSGIISQPDIAEEIVQTVTLWIKNLVIEFALKGVNSLDFMVNSSSCYALEINARPVASMQLYTANLLFEHMQCFLAGTLKKAEKLKSCQGYKIVFSKSEYTIKEQIQWPEWVADIPRPGAKIHTAMPICSIIAGGKNEQVVENSLLSKQQIIYRLLE